jgi:hypothetical protein
MELRLTAGASESILPMLEALIVLFVVVSAGIFIAHAIDSYRSHLWRAFY